MRIVLPSVVVAASFALTGVASASPEPTQTVVFAVAPTPRGAEAPYEYAPARTGFQVGIRASVQVPSGGLGGSSSFSDLFGPRFHMAFDFGSKLNPYVFFGGYAGFSAGMQGSAFGDACNATDQFGNPVFCMAESVDGGFVGIVTFLPQDLADPWLGVTAGYELQGFQYGAVTGLFSGISPSLLGGVDFRLRNADHKSYMSFGPYAGVTLQRYLTGAVPGVSVDTGGEPFHMWIQVGLRVTFPS